MSPLASTSPTTVDRSAKFRPAIERSSEGRPPGRVASIDVLRGFDMFWISGGAHLIHALAAVTGWASLVLLSHEMTHSNWAGFTFYDLIQPLFLFITGLTLPLTIGRRLDRGDSRGEILKRVFTRVVLLVVLGHIDKNGALSFHVAALRFTSVLGRIGVAWGAAALILMFFRRVRAQVIWCVVLLVGYWALLTFVPAPGQPAASYARGVNIVDYLDQHVMPGRLLDGNHDANGWCSTPPVIATVLFGALAGVWLLSARRPVVKVAGLVAAGAVLAIAGWAWGQAFPIIKHIWTSSYVLWTAGLSCLLLAVAYGVVDGLGWRRWAFPFVLIGVNPLVIYLLLSTKLINFPYIADFFVGFAYLHAPGHWPAVGQAVAAMGLQFAFLYVMYRRKIYLRV